MQLIRDNLVALPDLPEFQSSSLKCVYRAEMEKSHVKTFYNNLADEVDQHFARALQSATTPAQSQGGPSGGDATW